MTEEPNSVEETSVVTDTPPLPPRKRPRLSSSTVPTSPNGTTQNTSSQHFCPSKMYLVSVLSNDMGSKSLILHTRFEDSLDKNAIVILKKAPFPSDPTVLQKSKLVRELLNPDETSVVPESTIGTTSFPPWEAKAILDNDVYHRLLVTAGLESLNGVDMTVIHPAEPHHFKRFTKSGRHLIQETPEIYASTILPFLAQTPRDLSWVDNILCGKAEQDRVLFTTGSTDENGFTLVLDYRWNEQRIQEMHCLGIAHDPRLTCLRDLRAADIPLLKNILAKGREILSSKYTGDSSIPGPVDQDQIMAYLHYPPTFYRLHVHFVHVNAADDSGTRAGRAHLLEEVVRNLELCGDYYANRVMSVYLYDNSPMLDAVRQFEVKSTPQLNESSIERQPGSSE